jgi:N-methylhydantoinase A/oxoprolinase/acetone carboxylase beta subunit
MTGYAIGIDTGGTYTDAVVVDLQAHAIVAKAKALTTRGDLAIGVADALAAVLAATGAPGATAGRVRLVGLSTTLATNAIVEGHGSAIGVVLVGFDAAMAERTGIARAIDGARIVRVAGGHDHAGDEAAPLDEAAVAAFLAETADTVEAYAVTAQYSVRNPAHERRVREMVRDLTGRPATVSCDLAQALDAPRRALTAALNARIVGRIVALIAAVQAGMAQHAIAAPLMIVKGDGTLATTAQIAERPIETILSGPAASIVGAKFLSGLSDFVVADIGGTTTDIAVLEGGWPKLDRAGALVGGHRTMVQAVDMRTFALGGDSEIGLDSAGRIELRPGRIMPLALLGQRWPGVIADLRAALADPEGQPYAGRFALRPLGQRHPATGHLSAREAELLARVGGEPTALGRILRGPLARRTLDRLVSLGLVSLGGFTPSDAAHVLGSQAQWSREAALLGALLFARSTRMLDPAGGEAPALALAREVVAAVVEKTGRVLIEALADTPTAGAEAFIAAAVAGRGRVGHLAVRLAPNTPVVAVGGPAPLFYPEVGRRLGCEIVLPPDGDVANALGAAVAMIRAKAVVEISSAGFGDYRVHAGGAPLSAAGGAAALALAEARARALALERAAGFGLADPVVELRIDRIDLPHTAGDAGLVAATVVAECVGVPAAHGSTVDRLAMPGGAGTAFEPLHLTSPGIRPADPF